MNKAPSFQFYPRDYLTSRAVSVMTPEARGGYVHLLCHAWLSEEPGVLEDDPATLAALSGLGDRWSACEVSIRRAFRETSREGRKVLVQDRMVRERLAQERRYKQAAEGARVTNDKRWPSVAQRPDSESLLDRTAVTPASASASAVENLHTSPDESGNARVKGASRSKAKPTPKGPPDEWTEAFNAHFWPAYPRKVDKIQAAAEWERVKPRTEQQFNAIMDGLEVWKRHWRESDQEIVYAVRFLKRRRWEESPT